MQMPQTVTNKSVIQEVVVGSRILHERFGMGTVTAVSGSGMDKKATVIFDNVGQKQLLLRFAKFKVV